MFSTLEKYAEFPYGGTGISRHWLQVCRQTTFDNDYLSIFCSFLIGGDGKIYEGVGFRRIGAHTRDYTTRSLVIAFIGSFQGAFSFDT